MEITYDKEIVSGKNNQNLINEILFSDNQFKEYYNKDIEKQKNYVPIVKDKKERKYERKRGNIEICGQLYSKNIGNSSSIQDSKEMLFNELIGYRKRYWFMNDTEFRKYSQVRYLNKYINYIFDSIDINETRKIPTWMLNHRTYNMLKIKNGTGINKNTEKQKLLNLTNKYQNKIDRKIVETIEVFYTEQQDKIYNVKYKYTVLSENVEVLYRNQVVDKYTNMKLEVVTKTKYIDEEQKFSIKFEEKIPYYIELTYQEKEKLKELSIGDVYVYPNWLITKLNKYVNKFYWVKISRV